MRSSSSFVLLAILAFVAPALSAPLAHGNLGRQLGESALQDEGLAGLTAAAAASLSETSQNQTQRRGCNKLFGCFGQAPKHEVNGGGFGGFGRRAHPEDKPAQRRGCDSFGCSGQSAQNDDVRNGGIVDLFLAHPEDEKPTQRPDVSKPEARAVSHVNLGRQLGEDALNDEGLAGLTAAAAASLIQNSTQIADGSEVEGSFDTLD